MKEKIINTRVSSDLYKKIYEKAKKQRITISNLIRSMMEDTFEIYDDFSDLVNKKILELLESKDSILGYQEILINNKSLCNVCHKEILPKQKAFLAILKKNTKTRILVCENCYKV